MCASVIAVRVRIFIPFENFTKRSLSDFFKSSVQKFWVSTHQILKNKVDESD